MQSFTTIPADQIDGTDIIKMAELKAEILAQVLALLDCPAGRESGAFTDISMRKMEAEDRIHRLRANRYVRPAYGRDAPRESVFGARAGD